MACCCHFSRWKPRLATPRCDSPWRVAKREGTLTVLTPELTPVCQMSSDAALLSARRWNIFKAVTGRIWIRCIKTGTACASHKIGITLQIPKLMLYNDCVSAWNKRHSAASLSVWKNPSLLILLFYNGCQSRDCKKWYTWCPWNEMKNKHLTGPPQFTQLVWQREYAVKRLRITASNMQIWIIIYWHGCKINFWK